MDELNIEELKICINNFLFIQLPNKTTLEEMELIAMDILEIFIKHYENKNPKL